MMWNSSILTLLQVVNKRTAGMNNFVEMVLYMAGKKELNISVFSLPVVKFSCQQTHTGAHLLVGIEVYLYVLACNMLKRV